MIIKKIYTLIFAFPIIFFCCDDSFDQPSVVSVSPAHNSTYSGSGTEIKVTFSNAMDTVKTNGEFSLSSAGSGMVEGLFFWSGGDRELCFRPARPLTGTGAYTVRITTDAEDRRGNDLKEEFVSRFYINNDCESPEIVSFVPVRDSVGNSEDCQIGINFSEPVDMNSVYGSVFISPSVEGFWSGFGSSVTFVPLYSFSSGTTYTVNVGTGLCDMNGNSLGEALEFSFTVGSDFTVPEIVSVYQNSSPSLVLDHNQTVHGAEKDLPLCIDFSELVRADDLVSGIGLSPSCGFYITSSVISGPSGDFTRAVVNFTEDMENEETYTLTVSSGIRDMEGNSPAGDSRYVFVTDGEGSVRPVAVQAGHTDGAGFHVWPSGTVPVLELSASAPLVYEGVTVDFSASMDPVTLSVYADTVAGAGCSVSVTSINWSDSGSGPRTRLTFNLYNVAHPNLYKIVIRGGNSGLKDSRGNSMKEDFVQVVRF